MEAVVTNRIRTYMSRVLVLSATGGQQPQAARQALPPKQQPTYKTDVKLSFRCKEAFKLSSV